VVILKVNEAAYCSGSPDPGTRTNDLMWTDANLKFIKSVPNGKLYYAGPENARFPVVHVWGSAYEMGYAQGQLVKNYMEAFVYKTYGYLIEMGVDAMNDLFSPEIEAIILAKGMNRALDWCADVTQPFTPQIYYDELKGLADASGMDYQMLLRLNMFPEITKASCSFFGAWGDATVNGKTLQLRALDYDTVGPFKDYPQVTIYHPNDGNAFANIGWPGSIGMITGYSEQRMAISEIGVAFPDDSFGQGTPNTPPEKVHGKPWSFVTRDTLQFTNSIEAGIESIEESSRTCNLILGLGDGKEKIVNGLEYSGYVLVPYNDTTLLPANDTWHPQIPNVVYNGMDWLCPNYDIVLGGQLNTYLGKLDADVVIHDVLPTTQTGNLHIAVFDLTESEVYVSFCRGSKAPDTEPLYAYERQFTKLDMNGIFAETKPETSTK